MQELAKLSIKRRVLELLSHDLSKYDEDTIPPPRIILVPEKTSRDLREMTMSHIFGVLSDYVEENPEVYLFVSLSRSFADKSQEMYLDLEAIGNTHGHGRVTVSVDRTVFNAGPRADDPGAKPKVPLKQEMDDDDDE